MIFRIQNLITANQITVHLLEIIHTKLKLLKIREKEVHTISILFLRGNDLFQNVGARC